VGRVCRRRRSVLQRGMEQPIDSGRDCPALFARVRGNRMAKGGLENAVWDAEAQLRQQPLWKLLGGMRRDIACGVSIGIQDSLEQLLEKIDIELAGALLLARYSTERRC
jgi:O-succinylbenzoate synthase